MTEILYNIQNLPTKIISSDNKLEFEVLNWEEPNNGRMLWKVNVLFKNKNINDKVFENNWNYINESFTKLDLVDITRRYYYIPSEGHSTLYDSMVSSTHKINYKGTSTNNFKQNKFHEKLLIEIFSDTIQYLDIETKNLFHFDFSEYGRLMEITELNNQSIKVKYYTFQNNKRVELNKIIDFDLFRKKDNYA
ncbi:MAG: hypothetical protein U0W65_06610 [Bacteroidia bacterium]